VCPHPPWWKTSLVSESALGRFPAGASSSRN
jgi:hypothetical protein